MARFRHRPRGTGHPLLCRELQRARTALRPAYPRRIIRRIPGVRTVLSRARSVPVVPRPGLKIGSVSAPPTWDGPPSAMQRAPAGAHGLVACLPPPDHQEDSWCSCRRRRSRCTRSGPSARKGRGMFACQPQKRRVSAPAVPWPSKQCAACRKGVAEWELSASWARGGGGGLRRLWRARRAVGWSAEGVRSATRVGLAVAREGGRREGVGSACAVPASLGEAITGVCMRCPKRSMRTAPEACRECPVDGVRVSAQAWCCYLHILTSVRQNLR